MLVSRFVLFIFQSQLILRLADPKRGAVSRDLSVIHRRLVVLLKPKRGQRPVTPSGHHVLLHPPMQRPRKVEHKPQHPLIQPEVAILAAQTRLVEVLKLGEVRVEGRPLWG